MTNLPHTAAVLERVGAAFEGAIEVAVDFVLAFAALVDEGELEEGANISALAGEGDEDGDIGGVIFGVFAVRVKVNGPLVTAHSEILAGDVFTHADAFG